MPLFVCPARWHLHHAVGGDRVDVLPRVEAVVEGADVDVVDVEQQAAAGRVARARVRNSHSVIVERAKAEVGRGVLEHERPLEHVLHLLHARASRAAASPRRRAAAAGRGCCARGRPSSTGGRRPSAARVRVGERLQLARGSRGRAGRCCRSRARRRGARPGSARPRARARGAAGPPVSMKFSDSTSNQSSAGLPARISPKWTVRSPIPMPRSGRPKRFM